MVGSQNSGNGTNYEWRLAAGLGPPGGDGVVRLCLALGAWRQGWVRQAVTES